MQVQNQESDEEELGLLTQYIGLARGQTSNQTTKMATLENVELEKLKKPQTLLTLSTELTITKVS